MFSVSVLDKKREDVHFNQTVTAGDSAVAKASTQRMDAVQYHRSAGQKVCTSKDHVQPCPRCSGYAERMTTFFPPAFFPHGENTPPLKRMPLRESAPGDDLCRMTGQTRPGPVRRFALATV